MKTSLPRQRLSARERPLTKPWCFLQDEVGTSFDYEGDDFTLEKVITLGLDAHAEFIGATSGSASKEYQVEKSINDIEDNWSKLVLETVPYRDRGHHRIRTVEELYAALDDNAVVLGALEIAMDCSFSSPFSACTMQASVCHAN